MIRFTLTLTTLYMELRQATRTKAKLRIGLAGPSGSGKTYSALLLAAGITSWDKIAIIDTENGSADLYENLPGNNPDITGKCENYNVLTLTAPFTPERYVAAIKSCEKAGMEVIIIDSITHEWDGEGGLLEVHSKMPGNNSYTNWNKITPRHNAFIQAILQSKCHVITTVRKKQDYDLVKDSTGKSKPVKVGLKEITREGFEYELTLNLELDIAHNASVGKDRTGIFADGVEFRIGVETGKQLKEWAEEGKDPIVKSEDPLVDTAPPFTGEVQQEFMDVFNAVAVKLKWNEEKKANNLKNILGETPLEQSNPITLQSFIEALKKKL